MERKDGNSGRLKKRYIVGVMLLLALFVLLSKGCSRWLAGFGIILDNENVWQIKEYKKKAENIMTEYLADRFPGAKITWCDCFTVYGDAKGEYRNYLTDYVQGTFDVGENSYSYYVDIYTGEVYTDYYRQEIRDRVCPKVCEKLGIDNYVDSYHTVGKQVPVTRNKALDSYEFGETLLIPLPGDLEEDGLDGFVAEMFAGNGYEAYFTIQYDDDIRIRDMDLEGLGEDFKCLRFFLYHNEKESGRNHKTLVGRLEELYYGGDRQYRYDSYNIVEQDDIFLLYEEYEAAGRGNIEVNEDDKIMPDNFNIRKDDEKIEILLKEPARYYLCFFDTGFLGAEGLYDYRDASCKYLKLELIEDWGLGRYAVYAPGTGPYYFDKNETFYMGMPSN